MAVLVGLTACTDPEPVLMARRNLADEVALAMGQATPYESASGVTRAVLPGLYTEVLKTDSDRGLVIGDTADGFAVSFTCPAKLLGHPAVLFAVSQNRVVVAEPVRCPVDASGRAEVRLMGRSLPQALAFVLRAQPTNRLETPPAALPARARLEVALSADPVDRGAVDWTSFGPAPALFRVTAHDAGGRVVPVLERRLDPARGEDQGWIRVEADLEPARRALGADVRLVFKTAGESEGLPALSIWGDPTIVWPATDTARPRARNLVLVSIDTLRADRVGAYGAPHPTTPLLDALAAEGTLFETVIAQAPWTLPSHATMMTGLYGCAHGLVEFQLGHPFPAGAVPLAERLRRAGYTTAAVTEDGLVDAWAFQRGFAYYRENHGGEDRIQQTVSQAVEWLRTEAREPFFLFVHTYQVHGYFAPPPFADMFPAQVGAAGPPDAETLARYDAAVRYTDESLKPLVEEIRAAPRRDRVLLVVTSDHGEAFGEHGYTGHGKTLHEEVLRVPLLWWGPGLVARGRRVPGLVGLVDLAPSILALLGIAAGPEMQGISLGAQIRAGDDAPALPERTLFSENSRGGYQVAARGARWKTAWESGAVSTVDLDHDPGERSPGAAPDAGAAAARTRFDETCRQLRASLAAASTITTPVAPPIDPAQERRLKALGYVVR